MKDEILGEKELIKEIKAIDDKSTRRKKIFELLESLSLASLGENLG